MVEQHEPPPKAVAKRRKRTPEEIWIQGFLEYSGTDNITRFYRAQLQGVSLTRAVEAICRGESIGTTKCEGAGAVCTFRHRSDDDEVEVDVFFVAGEMKLEIQAARRMKEEDGEPDAA